MEEIINILCINALHEIHDTTIIITSYVTWEVMDIVHVLQINEVTSLFTAKSQN